jgi:hypothetical protein
VVFSFWDRAANKKFGKTILQPAERYALIIERGGWEMSSLVPRRYFFMHRDLFRMAAGRRTGKFNFCPTNPETIELLKKQGEKIFSSHPETQVLHLWPDKGHERTWCSCPACRAFTPEEQNRIAVNAAADALRGIEGGGQISCYEVSDEAEAAAAPGMETEIPLRPNVFRLTRLTT